MPSIRRSTPELPIAGALVSVGIVNDFYTRVEKALKRRYGVAGTSFVSIITRHGLDPTFQRRIFIGV